ncbi:hypothetical protein QO002_003823 [Pararhizobium capsulatum DSM 1112]|uniref:Uncharacterized protein n=2 Tax=Pararhizobium capsulatum TaxID=34014 RepID=A0ABU0BTT9_9HYPH|nr:hypothetical protein [Pararhizobium capsulatum DSM 1112]
MTTEDFTEYERRLAADHARLWKAIAVRAMRCTRRKSPIEKKTMTEIHA